MYYVDTKPVPRCLHASEPEDRGSRRGLREALRRLAEALGATGQRTWQQRRFAGLARLSATAGWTGRRDASEPGRRDVAEEEKCGPRAA